MKTTWTTKSGRIAELETSVIGKTRRDHIHTEYKLTIDGKSHKVIRPVNIKGQHGLEILISGTNKQIVAIDSSIAQAIADELQTVMDAVEHVDVSPDAYDRHLEMMTRLMDGE